MQRGIRFFYYGLGLCFALMIAGGAANAQTLPLPSHGNDIVGKIQTYITQPGDDIPKIAQHFEVTYTGLLEANPEVDPSNLKPGTALVIPSAYVLPNVPRKGIVVNVAELRLYYFPPHQKVVMTYPIGIGVQDWGTPLGEMKIIQKKEKPTWHIPPAVHAELAAKGFILPNQIPPGPDNPLGDYMMRLSQPTYLIHGVVDPSTVGRRSSSGCIRMYPEDIEQLFSLTKVGTPVRIINEPYKAGWFNGKLYVESHMPLQEDQAQYSVDKGLIVATVNDVLAKRDVTVDWDKIFLLSNEHLGLPESVGVTS